MFKSFRIFILIRNDTFFNLPRQFKIHSNPQQMLRSNRKNQIRWRYMTKQRDFFDEIGKQIGIQDWPDWYRVTKHQIKKFGGLIIFL